MAWTRSDKPDFMIGGARERMLNSVAIESLLDVVRSFSFASRLEVRNGLRRGNSSVQRLVLFKTCATDKGVSLPKIARRACGSDVRKSHAEKFQKHVSEFQKKC